MALEYTRIINLFFCMKLDHPIVVFHFQRNENIIYILNRRNTSGEIEAQFLFSVSISTLRQLFLFFTRFSISFTTARAFLFTRLCAVHSIIMEIEYK